MSTHSHNTFKAFIMDTEIAIDAHVRGLNNTPNNPRAMITVWSCRSLVKLLTMMIDKVMAQNDLVKMRNDSVKFGLIEIEIFEFCAYSV